MGVSIIIVNWNTCELLQHCLQSLDSATQDLSCQVIVVDNASTDGSAQMVKEQFPWVVLVENLNNVGFGRANNQALQMAESEFLLILNPDTILQAGVVQAMVLYLNQHPAVGAIGPRILNLDGSLQVSISPMPSIFREAWRLFHMDWLYPYSRYSKARLAAQEAFEVDVLKGACILLRKEIIGGIGLFDEQFFMYSEEVDLCWRIQKAGWQLHWLPSVSVIHYGSQSTKQIADQMFLELYRNKIKFFRKHQGELSSMVYKAILLIAALPRWLIGSLLETLCHSCQTDWKTISRQYYMLIRALPRL